jgi:hypothetical protein
MGGGGGEGREVDGMAFSNIWEIFVWIGGWGVGGGGVIKGTAIYTP